MAIVEGLDEAQLEATIRDAAERATPLIVTVSTEEGWLNYSSQIVSLRGGEVLVRPPTCDRRQAGAAFTLGQDVHLTFKLDNHKYTCTSAVMRWAHLPQGQDPKAPLLALSLPATMQRIQRRTVPRLDLAEDQLAWACFWLGDKDEEPCILAPERPIWLGRLLNFGIQGVRVLADRNSAEVFESGDHVGLRFSFAPGEQPGNAGFHLVQSSGADIVGACRGKRNTGPRSANWNARAYASFGVRSKPDRRRTGSRERHSSTWFSARSSWRTRTSSTPSG